jgi:hypothetical protein
MATPKTLSELTITFLLKAIDTSLGPTLGNVELVFDKLMHNGVELPNWQEQSSSSVFSATPKWVPMSPSEYSDLNAFFAGWAPSRFASQGVINASPGPTKKLLGEISLSVTASLNDVGNLQLSETRTTMNGVLFPTWGFQNSGSANISGPKWAPISAGARNELNAFIAAWVPAWLTSQGII